MKFGGGCLKDARSLIQAADIVRSAVRPPAVVVSAISGVTESFSTGSRSEAG